MKKGKALCTTWHIKINKRIRRRRKTLGERVRDIGFSAEEEITRIMKDVIDKLKQERRMFYIS